mmetsp:Transcript_80009/g.166388  ORF Transcript_80009/g.166388 Transcript_80009/m.166388 type:complete len:230 (+) Transcript_80009:1177-1866(+)
MHDIRVQKKMVESIPRLHVQNQRRSQQIPASFEGIHHDGGVLVDFGKPSLHICVAKDVVLVLGKSGHHLQLVQNMPNIVATRLCQSFHSICLHPETLRSSDFGHSLRYGRLCGPGKSNVIAAKGQRTHLGTAVVVADANDGILRLLNHSDEGCIATTVARPKTVHFVHYDQTSLGRRNRAIDGPTKTFWTEGNGPISREAVGHGVDDFLSSSVRSVVLKHLRPSQGFGH